MFVQKKGSISSILTAGASKAITYYCASYPFMKLVNINVYLVNKEMKTLEKNNNMN